MENERRNMLMDRILDPEGNFKDARMVEIDKDREGYAAIRECDRKARAWDKLKRWLSSRTRWSYRDREVLRVVLEVMADLLAPPKPKSKLERLCEFAKERSKMLTKPGDTICSPGVFLGELCTEAQRLETEDE